MVYYRDQSNKTRMWFIFYFCNAQQLVCKEKVTWCVSKGIAVISPFLRKVNFKNHCSTFLNVFLDTFYVISSYCLQRSE